MSNLPEIRCEGKKCNRLISKGWVVNGVLECKCGHVNVFKPVTNEKHRKKVDRDTQLTK